MPPLLPQKTARNRSSSPFSGPGGLTTTKCEILVWILPHGGGLSVAYREHDLAPSGSGEYFWREVWERESRNGVLAAATGLLSKNLKSLFLKTIWLRIRVISVTCASCLFFCILWYVSEQNLVIFLHINLCDCMQFQQKNKINSYHSSLYNKLTFCIYFACRKHY